MKFNVKILAISLILICCIMGAASAAEDVSTDVVDVADDSVAVDAVSDDVSDSLESVDDEAVVDESAPAQDDNDDVELEASVDDELSGQSPLLQDINDDKYVNASLIRDNYELGDGNSWETAFGWEWEGDYGYNGLVYAASRVNDNGTIHIYGNPIFIDEDSPDDPDSRGDIHPKKMSHFLVMKKQVYATYVFSQSFQMILAFLHLKI